MGDSGDGEALERTYLAAIKGDPEATYTAWLDLRMLALRYGTQIARLNQLGLAEDAAHKAATTALTTPCPWHPDEAQTDGTLPGRARLTTWFYPVWKHTALRILSKYRAGTVQIVSPQTLERYQDAAGDVVLELRDGIQFVRHALLTEPEYEIFTMITVAGMTIPEVCQELRCSHDRVRTLWRRARDIMVLYLLHLEGGMREAKIEAVYPVQPGGPTARERLRRALRLLRDRPGAWRVARRLMEEKKWPVAEIAGTWGMSQDQLNKGMQDDRAKRMPA